MLRVLQSQRRRLGMFSLGMAVFTTALLARFGTSWTDWVHLVFFFMSLAGYLFVAVGLFAVKPGQRGILEIAGFSALLTTVFLIYVPYSGLFPSLVGLAIFTGVMTGSWFFLGTRLSKKLGQNKTWRDSHAFLAPFPARRVWRHIVPGECEPSAHCTGTMLSLEELSDDNTTMRATFGHGKRRKSVYEITFLENDAPNTCRFYFQGTEADDCFVDGVFALNVTVMDRDSCFVSSTEERTGLSLGGLVERWFDNPLQFQHIRLLETLEDTYGEQGDHIPVPQR